jgi:hypothetical protein
MTKRNKIHTLDDIPDLISRCLLGIEDEIERILSIAADERAVADVKSLHTCLASLCNADKARTGENKNANLIVNMLPPEQIRQIAARGGQPAALAQKVESARREPTDFPLPLETTDIIKQIES